MLLFAENGKQSGSGFNAAVKIFISRRNKIFLRITAAPVLVKNLLIYPQLKPAFLVCVNGIL
jgi:hypothetical protein